MKKFLPITVTVNDETEEDVKIQNQNGNVWIRVGSKETGVDIQIRQSEDGVGLIIDVWDAATCEQHLGTLPVWFDDIKTEQNVQ
jgi:hypothetical protein